MKIRKQMKIPKNRFAHFDWLMTIVVVCCCLWGLFIIYSATHNVTSNPWSYLKTQGTAFFIGLVAFFFIALFDYEHYESLVKYIYAANVFLLILVLIIGTGENIGSKSWIRFGGFGFQPAEIVKVGFIITFAFHLSKIKAEVNSWKNVLFMCLHVGILIGLIMLQPDAGTAASFLIIFLFMVFMAGISYKYIAAAFGAVVLAAPILWWRMAPYQKSRILVFLDPERDPLGRGFHAIQSRIAVGSGSFTGQGFLHGAQLQVGGLPEAHTDFIFSSVSEEFGFLGSLLILALFIFIIVRCIMTAMNSKDDFGSFLCVGVAAMFTYHVFENIGMCIGLMPITGIPLPFFSYGGSSIIVCLITIGLVISVRRKPQMLNDIRR